MGSSSYWCETRRRIAIVNGMKSWIGISDRMHSIRNSGLTKNRLDFGWTSRKIREKPTARPIQRTIKPEINLANAVRGVKFPKALDRRNLGNASCSIARKQYSF